MTETIEQIDTFDLTILFGFVEDPKCMSRHRITPCSVTVTHIGIDCTKDGFLCTNAATSMQKLLIENKLKCKNCDRNIGDCWTIRPV